MIEIIDKNRELTKLEEELINVLDIKKKNSIDKIYLKELPNSIKNIFLNIPKINKSYICKKCGKSFYIYESDENNYYSFNYVKFCCYNNEIYILDIPNVINSYFNLIDNKNISNQNENIVFPLDNSFGYFFLFVELYNKIKENNNGDIILNPGFILFENILSMTLYDNFEYSKYLHILFVSPRINDNHFSMYNKIQELSNGNKFQFKKRLEIPINEIINEKEKFDDYQFQFYKLSNNIYIFSLHNYIIEQYSKIIIGPLDNIDINKNIINIFHDRIIFKDKEIINKDFINIIYAIKERNIISIDDDLLLGYDIYGKILFLFDLNNMNFKNTNLTVDDIYKIISLKNNPIKELYKNKNSFQFLLLGIQNLSLFEFDKETKSFNILKVKNIFNKNIINNSCLGVLNDLSDECLYIFDKNIFIFTVSNHIIFFDLKTFQIKTIIDTSKECVNLKKVNNVKLLYTIRKENMIKLVNLKKNKIKKINYFLKPNSNDIIIDERYIFSYFFPEFKLAPNLIIIYDLKNNTFQRFWSNCKNKIHYIYFFKINKNELGVFYIEKIKNEFYSLKAFIDIYKFQEEFR